MRARSRNEREILLEVHHSRDRARGMGHQWGQVREEVRFINGRVIVRCKMVTGRKGKRADYILFYKSDLPIAVVEAMPLFITRPVVSAIGRWCPSRSG